MVADLVEIVMPLPGNRYEFLQPIQMRFNELIAGVRSELAVKVFGDDFDTLIELGEEFRYEINVHNGFMYLKFTSEGHKTMKFTKNSILISIPVIDYRRFSTPTYPTHLSGPPLRQFR